MPCDVCGCACSSGGEAPMEELEAPLMMNIKPGPGFITAAPADSEVDEPTDDTMETGSVIVCCIARGLLALLWLYLVDRMRRNLIATNDGEFHLMNVYFVVLTATLMGMVFCQIGVSISMPMDPAG